VSRNGVVLSYLAAIYNLLLRNIFDIRLIRGIILTEQLWYLIVQSNEQLWYLIIHAVLYIL